MPTGKAGAKRTTATTPRGVYGLGPVPRTPMGRYNGIPPTPRYPEKYTKQGQSSSVTVRAEMHLPIDLTGEQDQ
eukprot:4892016-Prorocentrum_lima.AAC.1